MPNIFTKNNKLWVEMDTYPLDIFTIHEQNINTWIKYKVLKYYIKQYTHY